VEPLLFPDLTVSLSQRRWSCVLDPALALATPFGASLVRRLGGLMDLWMVRAFWQVLDSSEYYRKHPRALALGQDEDIIRRQLGAWERIRARSDLTGLRLFWIGDNQSESHLPEHAEPDLVQRYELLCESLERRPRPKVRLVRPLFDEQSAVAIEIASLASALHPVIVMTHWPSGDGSAPRLCRDLANLGLDCQAVAPETGDALAAIERNYLCHLLVHAGATPLFSAGLRLAVVHILAPDAALARTVLDELHCKPSGASPDELEEVTPGAAGDAGAPPVPDWWAGTQVFWYPVSEGAAAAASRQVDG
jgi:hypothetical protein